MNKYAEFSKADKSLIFRRVRFSTNSCLRKSKFKSMESAQAKADAIIATGKYMRVYKCKHCHCYHLTHKKLGEFDDATVSHTP